MATRAAAPKAITPTYLLHIELRGIKPVIWRRLLVPGSVTLGRLHAIILQTMGWGGGHLHEFIIRDDRYTSTTEWDERPEGTMDGTRVALWRAVGASKQFTYVYDFGDDWNHKIKVVKIIDGYPPLDHPECVGGENACPPEDVGGVPGYEDFLAAIRDPAHEDHATMLKWCGGAFDPATFDLDAVNAELSQIKFRR